MSEPWRLLDLRVTDPYDNQPIKEVLLTALKRNLIPNTLCFSVPRRYVWIGQRVNVEKRVNLEYCRREKIPVIRGILGGRGACTFDGDIIEYSLVSRNRIDFELVMNCIVKGLRLMGLEAELRPRSNDILVKGKKISGNAAVSSLVGGDVIVDFNYDLSEKALLSPPELYANKEASNIREWVTSIRAELGREVPLSEVVSALKEGFETGLQVEFDVTNSFTEAEEQILESLREKYRSEEWLKYGKWSPIKDYWRPK